MIEEAPYPMSLCQVREAGSLTQVNLARIRNTNLRSFIQAMDANSGSEVAFRKPTSRLSAFPCDGYAL